MSFRSALNAPQTNSGNVGLVKNGANPASSYTLVNNTNQIVDTITLGEGVWHVEVSYEATFSTAVISSQLLVTLTTPAGTIYSDGRILAQTLTGGRNFGFSAMAVLSAPTTITLNISAGFSSGSIIIDNPGTVSTQYITATKLA